MQIELVKVCNVVGADVLISEMFTLLAMIAAGEKPLTVPAALE